MSEKPWIKPAITGQQQPCLHAGVAESTFPPDGVIAVGFGYAALHKDGRTVWSEVDAGTDEPSYMTGAQAEALAAADPEHDWQIVLHAPLSERVYQRHAPGVWALIEQGQGFA